MNIKHSMCFSYDSDKSGAIDKKEMTRVMKSVYAMLGTKGSDKSSLDERVGSSILAKYQARFGSRDLTQRLNK